MVRGDQQARLWPRQPRAAIATHHSRSSMTDTQNAESFQPSWIIIATADRYYVEQRGRTTPQHTLAGQWMELAALQQPHQSPPCGPLVEEELTAE